MSGTMATTTWRDVVSVHSKRAQRGEGVYSTSPANNCWTWDPTLRLDPMFILEPPRSVCEMWGSLAPSPDSPNDLPQFPASVPECALSSWTTSSGFASPFHFQVV